LLLLLLLFAFLKHSLWLLKTQMNVHDSVELILFCKCLMHLHFVFCNQNMYKNVSSHFVFTCRKKNGCDRQTWDLSVELVLLHLHCGVHVVVFKWGTVVCYSFLNVFWWRSTELIFMHY
jgi:hypothetical protein